MSLYVSRSFFALLFLPLLWSANSAAAVLTWTLEGTTTSSTWSGTFDYDADTSMVSNVMIESTLVDATYGASPSYTIGGTANVNTLLRFFDVPPTVGSFVIQIAPEFLLTNAGGTIDLKTGPFLGEAVCLNGDCSSTTGYAMISGSVSAVPIPAAAWLFGSALLGLGGIGRRKKA